MAPATNHYDLRRNDDARCWEIVDTRTDTIKDCVPFGESAVQAEFRAQRRAEAYWYDDLIDAQIANTPDAVPIDHSEIEDCALIANAGGMLKNPYSLHRDLADGFTLIDTRTGRYVAWRSRDDVYDPRETSLSIRTAWLQELRIARALRQLAAEQVAVDQQAVSDAFADDLPPWSTYAPSSPVATSPACPYCGMAPCICIDPETRYFCVTCGFELDVCTCTSSTPDDDPDPPAAAPVPPSNPPPLPPTALTMRILRTRKQITVLWATERRHFPRTDTGYVRAQRLVDRLSDAGYVVTPEPPDTLLQILTQAQVAA